MRGVVLRTGVGGAASDRWLLLIGFLAPLTALFAAVGSSAFLLNVVDVQWVGFGVALGAALSLLLGISVGYLGRQATTFHNATAVQSILCLLALALRFVLPYAPALVALLFFALAQTLVFGAVGSMYGVLDAVAPIAEREHLFTRAYLVGLAGGVGGALLGLLMVAGVAPGTWLLLTFALVLLTAILTGVMKGRPLGWGIARGRDRVSRAVRGAMIAAMRRRYSLAMITMITSLIAFGLFAQLHLLLLRVLGSELNLALSDWSLLFVLLYGGSTLVGLCLFAGMQLWLRLVGVFTLLMVYPVLIGGPLLWWAINPSSTWAALTTFFSALAFFPSLFFPMMRYATAVLPSLFIRDILLLSSGIGGAFGMLLGSGSWLLLRTFMPLEALVRTSGVIDLVLLGMTVCLAMSYRWHWQDRLSQPVWRFHRPIPVSELPIVPSEEVRSLLTQQDPTTVAWGVMLATRSPQQEQYLSLIEPLIRRTMSEELRPKVQLYIRSLANGPVDGLLTSDSPLVRARTLEALVHDGRPVAIDRLAALLADSSSFVRLMACIASWQNGLESLAEISWGALSLAAISDEELIEVCDGLQERVPAQAIGVLKRLAYFPSSSVRARAIGRLAYLLRGRKLDDPELSEIGLRGLESEQPEVREAAIRLLVDAQLEVVIDSIAKLLHDPSMRVALAAAEGLARFGPKGVAHAVEALPGANGQVERAAIKALVDAGRLGEAPLQTYLQSAYHRARNNQILLTFAESAGRAWLPVATVLRDDYDKLVHLYSWVAKLKGYVNASLALQSLTVHQLLWREAATADLARWTAPRQLIAPILSLVRRRYQLKASLPDIDQQQELKRLLDSDQKWLQIGALLTSWDLHGSLPDIQPADPLVEEVLQNLRTTQHATRSVSEASTAL